VTTRTTPLNLLAAALLLPLAAAAQDAATAAAALPSAPSAQLAEQNESLTRTAGSNFVFIAPATSKGPGDVVIEQPQDGPLALSLDDAIALGLERNVRLKYDRANQRAVKGYDLGVINALLPNLSFDAQSSAQEVNLAAQGFKPSLFAKFASTGLIPKGFVIPTIVKVNSTQAQASLNQVVFSATDIEIDRGIKHETAVVDLNLLSDRGDLVLTTGMAYLQVLADQANLSNAQAQVLSAKTFFDQANARQQAGVGIHLDTLRAQVQYQQRQQDMLAAQNTLDKDTIQLARIAGIPAGQPLQLTDTAPFAQLAEMDLDAAKITAYKHRKDLLSLQQQIQVASLEYSAVKFQRLPTVAFNGFYGIIGLTNGPYHGDFVAEGTVRFPIFREAAQRGEEQVIGSQLTALRQREADLLVAIDAQIRSAMLDVTASDELVKVAQSNVALAQQELSDERDRFTSGVDDSLPVVDAEASVASAQAQLVRSLYQYNVAKLQLARSSGVIETRYRSYLGK
jgi:outer membrane protein TolC